MRILLIQPPARDFYDSTGRLSPLGLCYLKSALLGKIPGSVVKVLDARAGRGRRTVPLPPELACLREFYGVRDTGPFSTFNDFYHFGARYEDTSALAATFAPDLIGISSLFSAYHGEALDLAAELKKKLPRVPIVFGGPHASALPRAILATGNADYVLRGEGERPLVELVRALTENRTDLSAVPNLVWMRAGEIVENPVEGNYPLEEIPQPDFSDLDASHYKVGGKPLATLIASRGCPNGCAFCSVEEIFGKGHRRRSAESIMAEIKARHAEGYTAFDFEDDNLTLAKPALYKLLSSIVKEFGEGALSLSAMNGVNYQTLDAPTMSLMRRAGFSHLNVSLASWDEDACDKFGRSSSNGKFAEVVTEASSQGFLVTAYIILGLPGESVDSMLGGLAFLARLPVLIGVSPFYLAPGMALWRGEPTRDRLLRARLTALGQDAPECDRADVYTLFVAARIVNFLKGIAKPGCKITLEEALETAREAGGRDKLGAELLGKLLTTGNLSGWDSRNFVTLPKFRTNLFQRLLKRLDLISSRDGGTILLP